MSLYDLRKKIQDRFGSALIPDDPLAKAYRLDLDDLNIEIKRLESRLAELEKEATGLRKINNESKLISERLVSNAEFDAVMHRIDELRFVFGKKGSDGE